jgi:signal transduction histidine kinase
VAVYQEIGAMKELERQREEFLSAAAHDLKNPIASVRGQADLLARRLARMAPADQANPLVPHVEQAIKHIQAASRKMLQLVDELLDVSRLQSQHKLQLRLEPTDLIEVLNEVLEELRPTTALHTLKLDARIGQLSGRWDHQRLQRALSNLVANAIKYSPNGGEVIVRVELDGSQTSPWVILQVTDEGLGIPVDDLARIFTRFQRARNVGHIGGTGIGLAYAKLVAEQHGGTIDVTSTVGVGSTFTMRLPLQDE